MFTVPLLVGLLLSGQNPDDSWRKLPAFVLPDGLDTAGQRRALLQVAGSEPRLEELLRDSVTAPFILKLRDEKRENGDIIRRGDLWFVVHDDLDRIDPAQVERAGADHKPVEAGNMRFASHLLNDEERKQRGISPPAEHASKRRDWYVHLSGRLLDRIEVEATDRVTAEQSAESWVITSQTDPKFDRDEQFPNRWRPISDKDNPPFRPYPGGVSAVKITRLTVAPGALLVEAHFAFVEPHDWFEGAPILRSKISLIAQDRIRRLRRELAESHKKGESRKP